jgi:hypothetical protein
MAGIGHPSYTALRAVWQPGGLGPNQVSVDHQACLGRGGGHTTGTCLTCGETLSGPPFNTHCSLTDGPGGGAHIQPHVDRLAGIACDQPLLT